MKHSPSSSLLSHTQYGSVPLGIAAENGHTETVQRLLELGANIDQQNKVKFLIKEGWLLKLFAAQYRMVQLHSTVPHSMVMWQ